MTKTTTRVAAWIILAVWVAAFTRVIIDPTLPIPVAYLTPVVLVVAGYLFGQDLRDSLKPRKDSADDR